MSHHEQKPQNRQRLRLWAGIFGILMIAAIIYSEVLTHSNPGVLMGSLEATTIQAHGAVQV
jgi:hypothetical protein